MPTNYKGILDAFHQIMRDEGVLALWNGTLPSLLLVFNPAIQFMFYEGLKRQLLKKQTQVRARGRTPSQNQPALLDLSASAASSAAWR